jgi:hypothetical protein
MIQNSREIPDTEPLGVGYPRRSSREDASAFRAADGGVVNMESKMKTNMFVMLVLIGISVLPLKAEDWTVNGKDYHNVTVGKVEPDRVHITYDGGIGTVMLSDLSPDLQKRFNYNPTQAAAVTQKRDADQSAAEADMMAQVRAQAAAKRESDSAAAVQQTASDQSRWEHQVKASEIEALCAMVYLDQQAKAAQVHTAVSTGPTYQATSVTDTSSTATASAVDNHGNAVDASGSGQSESVTYTRQDDPAILKRLVQQGRPDLWMPGVPVAAAMLERPCTTEQRQWLTDFIACAKMSGGVDIHYGDMAASLTRRPPAPVPPAGVQP